MKWTQRAYRAGDRNFVMFSWLKSFAGSSYGKKLGASSARNLGCPDKYWDRHELIVGRLIREADVTIICDPEDEDIIWSWACTEGQGIVHYALAKHGFRQDGLAADMLTDLLGGRLDRPQTYTHEQVALRNAQVRIPATWTYDEFLLTGKWAA